MGLALANERHSGAVAKAREMARTAKRRELDDCSQSVEYHHVHYTATVGCTKCRRGTADHMVSE